MQIRNILTSAGCCALFAAAGVANVGSISTADKDFMIMAARADMTEAHEGQVFENRTDRADIKAFAKTLDQDHTKAYEELTELASKTGVSIPKGIDVAKDPAFEHLVHLKGERFDHAFAADEVAAHRHAIAMFKREAEHGKDAEVKAYAAKMVPVLEKHLRLAEEIAKPAKRS
jgi:putative membrane protein